MLITWCSLIDYQWPVVDDSWLMAKKVARRGPALGALGLESRRTSVGSSYLQGADLRYSVKMFVGSVQKVFRRCGNSTMAVDSTCFFKLLSVSLEN